MANILITGCNGFFGRNLVRTWQDRHNLIGIDDNSNVSLTIEPVSDWHRTVVNADITEGIPISLSMRPAVDTVIHLAARTRIPHSWLSPNDYYYNNVIGSQKLFESAARSNVKKFIYFSSSSVYGDRLARMKETDRLSPTNPYAVSKVAAELALTVAAKQSDTELIIVRPFTMYGDYMNYGKLSLAIPKFVKSYLHDLPLTIDGTGSQERDYIHANDAINALDLIMEHGRHGDVFNIGTGQYRSIQSIADKISQKQVRAPERPGAMRRTWANISKLEALGFEPKVDFDQWLTVYLETIKTHKDRI